MAAPIALARGTPRGAHLRDGFRTLITFEADANITFWEKKVKPFGLDGGDKIDETTMHNIALRTYHPRSLYEVTDMTLTVAYDPVIMADIGGALNRPQAITILFPNGDEWVFFGYLMSFEPNDCAEGEQPEAEITLVATNVDPDVYSEEAPVISTNTAPL